MTGTRRFDLDYTFGLRSATSYSTGVMGLDDARKRGSE